MSNYREEAERRLTQAANERLIEPDDNPTDAYIAKVLHVYPLLLEVLKAVDAYAGMPPVLAERVYAAIKKAEAEA